MVIIPGVIQQIEDDKIVQFPVLWVDGDLTRIDGEKARATRNGASRAAWRAGWSLYAMQDKSSSVILRRFNAGEEERLMEAASGSRSGERRFRRPVS